MAHQKGIWRVLQGNVTLHVLSHNLYLFTSQAQELHCCTAQGPPRGVRESCCAVELAVLLEFPRFLLCLHRHIDGRGGDCVGDWLVAVTDRINVGAPGYPWRRGGGLALPGSPGINVERRAFGPPTAAICGRRCCYLESRLIYSVTWESPSRGGPSSLRLLSRAGAAGLQGLANTLRLVSCLQRVHTGDGFSPHLYACMHDMHACMNTYMHTCMHACRCT
jgi:hypothetical protein